MNIVSGKRRFCSFRGKLGRRAGPCAPFTLERMVHMEQTTPGYISALVKPLPGRGTDRRAWSIPLAGVWIPFFTATKMAATQMNPVYGLRAKPLIP